jgi:hypothetical protein
MHVVHTFSCRTDLDYVGNEIPCGALNNEIRRAGKTGFDKIGTSHLGP